MNTAFAGPQVAGMMSGCGQEVRLVQLRPAGFGQVGRAERATAQLGRGESPQAIHRIHPKPRPVPTESTAQSLHRAELLVCGGGGGGSGGGGSAKLVVARAYLQEIAGRPRVPEGCCYEPLVDLK